MSLSKQLGRWQAAGLIDADTRKHIIDFEAKRSRPRIVYGLAALGAVSIGIGVISIVASNWDGIGPYTKLALDLMLALGLSVGMYRAVRRGATLWVEALGIVYYLFTLASLALVGQVYQLGTPTWQALAVWFVVTLPMVLVLTRPLAGIVWYIGSFTSYVTVVTELVDAFDYHSLRNDLAVGCFAAWPLLVMLLVRLPWGLEQRRRFVRAVDTGAWGTVVLAGALAPFVFYANVTRHDTLDLGLLLGAGVCVALHFCQRRWLGSAPKRARLSVSLLLAVTWLTFSLGTIVPHRDLDLVGALAQVGYCGLLAFTSLQFGWVRAFHALTGVIALRILIIYFEVFGSMLSTGLGLVSGGLLTLLLAWVWKRKSPQLAVRLEPGAHHAT